MGSMTAPDRMWAPTSEPFSSTTTDSSLPGCGGQLLQADGGGQARRARRRRRPRRSPSPREAGCRRPCCHRLGPRIDDQLSGSIGRRCAKRQASDTSAVWRPCSAAANAGRCSLDSVHVDEWQSAELAAVLDWYRDMGAEQAVGESPVDWLAAAATARPAAASRSHRPERLPRARKPTGAARRPAVRRQPAAVAAARRLPLAPPHPAAVPGDRPRCAPCSAARRPRGRRRPSTTSGRRSPASTAAASRRRPRTCASTAVRARRASC